jgi:hypothetical protein
MASPNNDKLAVLIDADNAQASIIHELLSEVSRYGTASVKRAYGDWTTTNLKGWKEVLHKMAIQPMQQFSYTMGKNATEPLEPMIRTAVTATARDNGWAPLSSRLHDPETLRSGQFVVLEVFAQLRLEQLAGGGVW